MASNSERLATDLTKRSYSEEEIAHIYELGRFHLENGLLKKAEPIFRGLTEVAPEFTPGWLGLAYVDIQNRDYESAITATRQALKRHPQSVEAMLFLVVCLMTNQDFSSAGTLLGEVGELIESGQNTDPNVLRFFRAQLARYQARNV